MVIGCLLNGLRFPLRHERRRSVLTSGLIAHSVGQSSVAPCAKSSGAFCVKSRAVVVSNRAPPLLSQSSTNSEGVHPFPDPHRKSARIVVVDLSRRRVVRARRRVRCGCCAGIAAAGGAADARKQPTTVTACRTFDMMCLLHFSCTDARALLAPNPATVFKSDIIGCPKHDTDRSWESRPTDHRARRNAEELALVSPLFRTGSLT